MWKTSILFLFLIVGHACKKDENNMECIDSYKIDLTQACIEIYQPVCGCNEKTYPNSCFAKINGLNTWIEGDCI